MQYITSNGVKLAVYDYNKEGCETIFFIHGWPLSNKIFEYQVNLLVEMNYRVITVDLRGFGNSDAAVSGYDYNQLARDIFNIVNALRLNCFILAGFSMGGAIALRYMRLFNGYQVKRLILLASASPCFTRRAGFPYGITKESVDDMINAANTDRPQLCKSFTETKLFVNQHSQTLKDWVTGIGVSASGIGTIKSAISLRDEDGREDIKCLKVPVFIIRGEKDEVVPKELTDLQHELIPCSTLYSLKNSAHYIMYDELVNFNNYLIKAITD